MTSNERSTHSSIFSVRTKIAMLVVIGIGTISKVIDSINGHWHLSTLSWISLICGVVATTILVSDLWHVYRDPHRRGKQDEQ